MKKISFLLLVSVAILLVMNVSCLSTARAAEKDSVVVEYEALSKKFEEKISAIKSRDEFKALLDERNKDLEAFLKKLEGVTPSDQVVLTHGKVLLDLRRFDEALKKFESLIGNKSVFANAAKFEKVKILLQKEKLSDAVALFTEIENKVEKNGSYIQLLYAIAYSSKDKQQMDFSQKFIDLAGDKEQYAQYKAQMYQNMASAEKERGNLKKAVEILEKAVTITKQPQSKRALESSLKQYKMIGVAAPEISAETWINSEPLKLADLKGKVVIVDFWATWCNPCRIVIPWLVEFYSQYKDKGLVVIGFTRVQGYYADDKENKGKLPADEEKKLTKEFIKRLNINYPIAISDGKSVFETYGISAIPTMFMIDKNGNITSIQIGVESKEALKAKIKQLLN